MKCKIKKDVKLSPCQPMSFVPDDHPWILPTFVRLSSPQRKWSPLATIQRKIMIHPIAHQRTAHGDYQHGMQDNRSWVRQLYVGARDTKRTHQPARPAFSLLFNLSHSVSPRGAVHADFLAKHQRRVRVCRKPFFFAHRLVQLPQRPRVFPSPIILSPPSETSPKMLSKVFSRRLLASRFSRGLATHAPNPFAIPAALHLKSGQSFHGRSFGAPKSIYGETVFSTSITSCELFSLASLDVVSLTAAPLADTESMTDPSYRGQILVFTTPMIGNYGVPLNKAPTDSQDVGMVLESRGVQCAGVIVADVAEKFSHHSAVESIHSWCERYGVPGITGVDTRAITTLLRDQGTTLGRIAVGAESTLPAPKPEEYWDPSEENLVNQASTKKPYVLNPEGDIKIAVLDFGAKANIMRSLVRRGAAVHVLPWNYDFNTIRDNYDGLFLTNGPGDPKHCIEAALKLRKTLEEWKKPVFGICMGHQVIGIAAGLDAYRMTFGNRGHNQPVLALASSGSIKAGRVYVTRCVPTTRYCSIF